MDYLTGAYCTLEIYSLFILFHNYTFTYVHRYVHTYVIRIAKLLFKLLQMYSPPYREYKFFKRTTLCHAPQSNVYIYSSYTCLILTYSNLITNLIRMYIHAYVETYMCTNISAYPKAKQKSLLVSSRNLLVDLI